MNAGGGKQADDRTYGGPARLRLLGKVKQSYATLDPSIR
jgi:hypothetical protein